MAGAIPPDTSEEAFRIQTEAYRRLAPEARVDLMLQMSEEVREVAAAGIRRRHGEYGDNQVRLALYRLMYGDELFRAAWPDHEPPDP
jgi:hypothetical protein